MEENKKREEEIETLDLFSTDNDKKLNEDLEGTSEENIKEVIVNKDLNEGIKSENLENKLLENDNPVDNVFGEEFVGLDDLEDTSMPDAPKKRKGLLIIIIFVVLLAGFGVYMWYSQNNLNNNEGLQETMRTSALDYFDKYTSANTGAAAYTITLGDLKKANDNGENYDLSSLKNCDDDKTQVIINIDYSNGKVKDTEVRLKCKVF